MMKKKTLLINIAILTVILGIFLLWYGQSRLTVCLDDEGNPALKLDSDSGEILLKSWFNEADEKYYFFLPSFAWGEEKYVKDINEYDIVFLKSENIPAVFINTESGGMEYLLESKENSESGTINIIEAAGNVEYSGILESISGRGNTTWEKYSKKPYSIKLEESKALLGMGKGRKWYLLPVWREGNRMNTKIAFDMAQALGLLYTPQCTWVDLYLNGEYVGNYLLSESISVGSGRVDIYDLEKENLFLNKEIEQAATFADDNQKGYVIKCGTDVTGGYLIEKDLYSYYEQEECGFITNTGKLFTINSPGHASKEQVTYIRNYVQMIEDMIMAHDTDYQNYIDLDSFVKRFLVDEISLNCDSNITSMFFYKDKNDDVLYAGPVWDYDGSMGEINSGWMEGRCVDYKESTIRSFRNEDDTLGWYESLYEDEIFYEKMREIYQQTLPAFEQILEERIDQYAEKIRASAQMDAVRWQNEDTVDDYPGHYQSFDNNVRYLKYFLSNRLNYLNERWEIPYDQFEVFGNGEMHQVIFKKGEEIIEIRQVEDGEVLTEPPYLDEEVYWGWYYEHSMEKLRGEIPVYEDVVLFAREK